MSTTESSEDVTGLELLVGYDSEDEADHLADQLAKLSAREGRIAKARSESASYSAKIEDRLVSSFFFSPFPHHPLILTVDLSAVVQFFYRIRRFDEGHPPNHPLLHLPPLRNERLPKGVGKRVGFIGRASSGGWRVRNWEWGRANRAAGSGLASWIESWIEGIGQGRRNRSMCPPLEGSCTFYFSPFVPFVPCGSKLEASPD